MLGKSGVKASKVVVDLIGGFPPPVPLAHLVGDLIGPK
jgi:hypothetical protein